jgi:predicted RNA-binding protein YlxR (DUF448 family)
MIAPSQETELDSGPHSRERERMCVVTREVRPVADLIRFVIGPDGEAVPDLKRRLPGRGVWVTATHDALAEAVKRKALARGFKRQVRLAADLVVQTERLLERAVLDALAMAGKAGLVASGFGKTEAALARDRVVGVIHAAEAAADGVRKLDAALRRLQPEGKITVISGLTSAHLDLALGRPNVVHAALLAGPASDTFLARFQRLERFRAGDRAN